MRSLSPVHLANRQHDVEGTIRWSWSWSSDYQRLCVSRSDLVALVRQVILDPARAQTSDVAVLERVSAVSALVVLIAVGVALHELDHALGEVALLQPVVHRHRRVGCLPCRVCGAGVGDGRGDLDLGDLVRSFQQQNAHARRQVPRNVAVERPHPGVVLRVLDDLVVGRPVFGSGPRHVDVAAGWVRWVDDRAVPRALAFGQDLEVVSVDVHWMRCWEGVDDDDSHCFTGAGQVDVSLRWEIDSRDCVEEGWFVKIAFEADVVERPAEDALRVRLATDRECDRCVWLCGGDGVLGY